MLKNIVISLLLTTSIVQNDALSSYYPYGDEIDHKLSDHKLSDHKLIAIDIDVDGGKIPVASYNTWARGTLNGFMDKPGYEGGRKEPDVEKRINDNNMRIHQFLQSKENAIIGLQGVNLGDLKKMEAQLGSTYSVLSQSTLGESFNHAIVYKASTYTPVNVSSNDIDVLNNLRWSTPQGASGTQQNRYLHVKLKNNATSSIFDIVNVHLKWQSQLSDIQKALQVMTSSYSNLIVIGDFNQDLSSLSFQNATIAASVNGSQVYDFTTRKGQFKTNDVIFYKLGSTINSSHSNDAESNEIQALLTRINNDHHVKIMEMYEANQFDIRCVRALAEIPYESQDQAIIYIFESYMLSHNNAEELDAGLQRIKNKYSSVAPYSFMFNPYQSYQNQTLPIATIAPSSTPYAHQVYAPQAQQTWLEPNYGIKAQHSYLSQITNEWGKYTSFDECLIKGITGRLQERVRSLYNKGMINSQQIVKLSSVSFKAQGNKWFEIIGLPL